MKIKYRLINSKVNCGAYNYFYLPRFIWAVICLVFFSASIHADDYIQVDELFFQNFHYKEYNDFGVLLDREDGNIPGVGVAVAKDWGDHSSILNASFSRETVKYDGRTAGGSLLTTDTKEQIVDVTALILWAGTQSENHPNLITGIGYRKWDRDIQATASTNRLREIYKWPYWIVGVNFAVWQHSHWKIGFDWRLTRTIKPSIYVKLPGFDNVNLDLGTENSFRVSVPISYQINPNHLMLFEAYYQTWNVGNSRTQRLYTNGSPTAYSVSEPESFTEVYGVSLSVRFNY